MAQHAVVGLLKQPMPLIKHPLCKFILQRRNLTSYQTLNLTFKPALVLQNRRIRENQIFGIFLVLYLIEIMSELLEIQNSAFLIVVRSGHYCLTLRLWVEYELKVFGLILGGLHIIDIDGISNFWIIANVLFNKTRTFRLL